MKKTLNWKSQSVVNIFDEVTLWSAPFGRLLLEHIPMQAAAKVLDIGFGTGFPLVELSQRFGERSIIYGVDIWKEGIERTQYKIDVLELENIQILEGSATHIALEDEQMDLITSNLGVNNFDDKEQVYAEINRILKSGGKLCITTNPIGTFQELFDVFKEVLQQMKEEKAVHELEKSIERRKTKAAIVDEIEKTGLRLVQSQFDTTNLKFVDPKAVFDHSLIRIGFRSTWEEWLNKEKQAVFFQLAISRISDIIDHKGVFVMSIPMLYLGFEK